MPKRLIASLAAAAIALTTFSAAPARALDSGELSRLVLGTGIVLMLGHELGKRDRRGFHGISRNTHNYNRHNYNRHHYRHDYHQKRGAVTIPRWCIHGYGPSRWVDWTCVRRSRY